MSDIKNRWHRVPKLFRVISYVIMGLVAAVFMGLIFGYAIKLLWNWLMPTLFNLKKITYWQGIGIFVLARIIFGFGSSSSNKEASKKKQKVVHVKEESKAPYSKWHHWEYYDEWWEKEGKNAFGEYLNEKQEVKDKTEQEEKNNTEQ